jgi:DNA-directed RNA polymerase subunit RPC12/RpoP
LARADENAGFTCAHCGAGVLLLTNGSYRNHCPFCLWSMHVDDARPGDRLSECHGLMQPVALVRKRKGLQIVHRCARCGKVQPNKVATGTLQADDFDVILEVMRSERAYAPRGDESAYPLRKSRRWIKRVQDGD